MVRNYRRYNLQGQILPIGGASSLLGTGPKKQRRICPKAEKLYRLLEQTPRSTYIPTPPPGKK